MDVSFVKIWSAGFPDFCIRIESFDGDPGPIADSFVVCVGQNKKCIQFIVLRFDIDMEYNTTNNLSIQYYAIGCSSFSIIHISMVLREIISPSASMWLSRSPNSINALCLNDH